MRKAATARSTVHPLFSPEPPEPRILLAADGAALEARGFVPMNWHGQAVHVQPGEWILGLDGVGGASAEQIAEADKLLGRFGVSVTRHLGSDGLLLVESDKSLRQLENLVQRLPGARYIQPNFAL